ncbi:MAG: phytanoyl-CoA dioxygenase family protein [Pseudomonadales bacterium]
MMFDISQEEKYTGIVTAEKLSAIVEQIQTVGFAVVANLVSKDVCDLLDESVQADTIKIRETGKPTAHERNTGQGHLQLGLRRFAPYVNADLVANPIIESIVAGILGKSAWLGFYNGNVNCPGSTYQPLHMDRPFSWKTPEEAVQAGQSWPPPATTISCSVALEEITVENGATEIYPRTHHATEVINLLKGSRLEDHPDLLERWGPATRMEIPAGGAVIRDPRLWHRGVPNPSGRPRAMIAVTYHSALGRHWRGRLVKGMDPADIQKCEEDSTLRVLDNGELGDGRLVFQEDTREAFESSKNLHSINRNVRFVEEPFKVNHFLDAHLLGGARVVSDDVSSAIES